MFLNPFNSINSNLASFRNLNKIIFYFLFIDLITSFALSYKNSSKIEIDSKEPIAPMASAAF